MKNKIVSLIALIAIVLVGCQKKFLEEMKPYNQYGEETVFTNEVLTGYYIDRLYNYFFVNLRSPTQAETTSGSFDDSKTRMTEEIGGTVSNYINPNRNLQLATEADAYYGGTLSGSVTNSPYTRIRFANFLHFKSIDLCLNKNQQHEFK
ncbi:MAG: hypothetical protein EOO85_09615 [Pedobacter sp.]|nr:MAG: hypothetical protein EOO85_09615 [Pedobacter sp.]